MAFVLRRRLPLWLLPPLTCTFGRFGLSVAGTSLRRGGHGGRFISLLVLSVLTRLKCAVFAFLPANVRPLRCLSWGRQFHHHVCQDYKNLKMPCALLLPIRILVDLMGAPAPRSLGLNKSC